MKNFENKYCVYGLVVTANNQNYIYVGSGDYNEPSKRVYDFKKQHSLSKRINNSTKGNYWKVQKVIFQKGITKKQALLIENEVVGVLYGHEQCLNQNRPVKSIENESKEDLQFSRQRTVNFLQVASWVRMFENNPLAAAIGINEGFIDFYKTAVKIVEDKANQLK